MSMRINDGQYKRDNDCRQLVKLNVSYNEIVDISGLAEFVNVAEHPLTVLELQGNQIRLVTHVIKNCRPLANLRQLVLSDNNSSNPVCKTPGGNFITLVASILLLRGLYRLSW